MRSDVPDHAAQEGGVRTRRRRHQEGLIREALYIFLAVAIVMAVLLDGLALFTVQQEARDDAADAGAGAKQAFATTGSVDAARAAATEHAQANEADLVAFSITAPQGTKPRTFVVTVQHHTDTYVFKYLRYLPGLEDWVEEMQNPTITKTTR